VIVADAVQLVQPLAQDAGQVLTFDVTRDFPMLYVDSDMIIRVLINLMENAVKYTPEGGAIHLKATSDENNAYFTISDSGPGIPPDKKASIFDKFSRVKYQDAPKGVGLGLAFCRLAVEAHGGDIHVESEEGKGSDFIVRLPLVKAPTLSDDERKRKTTTRLATTA
jgi:two-component system, NtrC family, sensor histidine kinase KinB